MSNETKTIGIPFHNVRSWYFRRTFHGPEHWDILTDSLRTLINRELEYFEPADYWFEISNDQVANVISVVRLLNEEQAINPLPGLELSLNRSGELFCLSLSVVDFYDAEQLECADHASDHLDAVIREILEDVYANPF
jgi:hypothetical protein